MRRSDVDQDIVDCFKKEFGEIAQLEFVTDPASLAGKGYALNTLRVSGGKNSSSVGLDIVNASTILQNNRMIEKGLTFIKKILDKKDRRQEIIADFRTTIIRVDDDFISSSSIVVDEALTGNIYSLREVIIAATAEIAGNVTSRTASISGRVSGDIVSMEYADIKSTAVIKGSIRAKALSIERGAIINGSVRVENEIDECDLQAKLDSRLPSGSLRDPAFIARILPAEDLPAEPIFKPDMRPSETNKRMPASAFKNKQTRPAESGGDQSSPGGWY